jgi:SAM-dependent methyltransferase
MAEWFVDWFNTAYYHILYKSRSDIEAQIFVDNLETELGFSTNYTYCDMACGKGRHAIYLNKKGYKVWGLDLSTENIKFAKNHENESLKFHVHDIRNTYKTDFFDVVLNLFTSFGYFENNLENQNAIVAIAKSIKPGGTLVLDYMNSRKAIEEFNTHYIKSVDGIDFTITKKIEKGYIFKKIKFNDKGQNFEFEERVKLIFLEDFKSFFVSAGLQLTNVYGNYALDNYDELKSDRMVMICKKTKA